MEKNKGLIIKNKEIIKEIKEHFHLLWNELLDLKATLIRLQNRAKKNETADQCLYMIIESMKEHISILEKECNIFITIPYNGEFYLEDVSEKLITKNTVIIFKKIVDLLDKKPGDDYEWI